MNEEQCERLVKAFEKIAESFKGLTDAVYTLEGAGSGYLPVNTG